MKYDIDIVVPVETSNRTIKTRINDFKKYGFINTNKIKARLNLLASEDNNDEFEWLSTGWPENIEINIIHCPYNHVAQKIYYFYHKYLKADIAKWYMRIDEDSVNDLEGLIQNLDRYFDYEREYHIASRLLYDIYPLDQKLLTILGFGWWYRNSTLWPNIESPAHEQEISITSNAAIKKVTENPKANKYFQLRKEFPEGYGDHGLCHALRMSKIYGVEVKFISHESDLWLHSYFGGHKNHVHWVGRDKCPKYMEWMDYYEKTTFSEIENKVFLIEDKENKNANKLVKFFPDQKIKLYDEITSDSENNNTVGLWCKKEDKIIIILDSLQKVAHFTKNNDIYTYEKISMIEIN
jgi:hypothetical protein